MIIQFCGLSGSGKSTLALGLKKALESKGKSVEILDGDEYRKGMCADLGFSKQDRNQNIRSLAFVASRFSKHNIIAIICAINPYEDIRIEVKAKYENVKTVFVECSLNELINRDTKGLYQKAFLPEGHPDKLMNLSGVNDPFEIPIAPDLIIRSDKETVLESINKLVEYIDYVMTSAPHV